MQIVGIDTNWIYIFTAIECWWNLNSEKLRDLCRTPNIIQLIKSIRMRLEGNGARVGDRTIARTFLVGKSERPETTWKTWT
jgi:hypothetical protein